MDKSLGLARNSWQGEEIMISTVQSTFSPKSVTREGSLLLESSKVGLLCLMVGHWPIFLCVTAGSAYLLSLFFKLLDLWLSRSSGKTNPVLPPNVNNAQFVGWGCVEAMRLPDFDLTAC